MFHVEHRRMDYHLHTNHSMDGRQTMPELCETMLARGVQEIALTEHIEPGHPEEEMDVPPVWADWFAEIARCRAAYPALIIRSGIEIGDNPLCRAETKALLDTLPLDFRLRLGVFPIRLRTRFACEILFRIVAVHAVHQVQRQQAEIQRQRIRR